MENTTPSIVHLDNLNEDAIQVWWDEFRRTHKWRTLTQNCSTTVAQALDVGGGRDLTTSAPNPLVWTPSDVEKYARALQNPWRLPPKTPFGD
jgi:hypothetical protein